MYITRILTILFTSLLFSSSFIPNDQQILNYTQIYFSWPQVVGAIEYEIKIYEVGSENEFLVYTTNSNSFLLESGLDWDKNYNWEIFERFLSPDEYIYQNSFTTSPLPDFHPDQLNILHIDELNYSQGINILDFESFGYAIAIDKSGNEIWFANKDNFYSSKIISVELLDNGNFTGFTTGIGYEFTIDSEIIFQTPEDLNVHHHIIKTNHDTYFIIDAEIEYHQCPQECSSDFSTLPVPWQGDRFIELNNLGDIVWEWNSFDHISLSEYNPYYAETYNGTIELDWTHSNSVLYDETTSAVYVSIRNLSRVTSIDYESGQINWNLGEPDFMDTPSFNNEIGFSQQHSVQLTDSGNLIFFDNGRFQDPELSRCIEVGFNDISEPVLIWEHVLPDSMFTGSRGECDRLENGNSLISAGRTGNIIEVDQHNQLVWHLRALDNHGNNISIYRTQRAKNLFPNIFSFHLDDLLGSYGTYEIVNNGSIALTIFNKGWGDQLVEYSLLVGNQEILNGEIVLDSTVSSYELNTENYSFNEQAIYTLRLNSSKNINVSQQIFFNFIDPVMGDVNSDGDVNISDVLLTLEMILNELTYSEGADLNQDLNIDLLDIILIINMIL